MTTISPSIPSPDALDDLLSTPTPGVVEALARLEGDLLILGVGGKMGPTLARMAVRASQQAGVKRRVIGVARFSNPELPAWLQAAWRRDAGLRLCSILRSSRSCPTRPTSIVMTALKFGSTGRPGDTWAVNCWMPANICQRYAGSRIAGVLDRQCLSALADLHGGSLETDPLAPVGEYAASCVGRERMYDYFSRRGWHAAVDRAAELRLRTAVRRARRSGPADSAGEPIDLTMGAVNVIWQGDANAMTLQSLAHAASPPFVVNVAGPETLSVRRICEHLGELLGKPPVFSGTEGADGPALSNGHLGHQLFGYPRVPIRSSASGSPTGSSAAASCSTNRRSSRCATASFRSCGESRSRRLHARND